MLDYLENKIKNGFFFFKYDDKSLKLCILFDCLT